MPGFNDNPSTAGDTASTFNDPRVRHFYDAYPKHVAGKVFAEGLIAPAQGPAWDIYFFYNKGMEWESKPPEPTAWMHQLGGGGRADPDRFHTGDDLINRLHAAMHLVSGEGCTSH